MSATTDQINATVSSLWPLVQRQQEAYLSANGCYCQMLWTHETPPTADTPPDNLDETPTYEQRANVVGLPPMMRARIRIDTYGKPDGWTLTMQAMIDGVLWERCIDCGVDASRSRPWSVVVPPPPAAVVDQNAAGGQ
jgi:hypothetical protein